MHEWSKRMLLRHYLKEGVTKTELARRFGVSRRTIHYWIESGQLDRDMVRGQSRYPPRPEVPSKLDSYKASLKRGCESFRGSRHSGCATRCGQPAIADATAGQELRAYGATARGGRPGGAL